MTHYHVCNSLESNITYPLDSITIIGVIILQHQNNEVRINRTMPIVFLLPDPYFGPSFAYRELVVGVWIQGLLDSGRQVTDGQLYVPKSRI